ncbi:hypothetical protein I601_1629 [Nocardioides dokdonensis FR1436]|uniref:Uncharacterized protein n=1 Tax=Nocardioides dokdonensis FR1436 TaxID=1300347 RepID=A0A1A9GKQ8_9ACTN|nr:hypothetical protein I601_1629 [Nocardioides dokdonensis FR1436]
MPPATGKEVTGFTEVSGVRLPEGWKVVDSGTGRFFAGGPDGLSTLGFRVSRGYVDMSAREAARHFREGNSSWTGTRFQGTVTHQGRELFHLSGPRGRYFVVDAYGMRTPEADLVLWAEQSNELTARERRDVVESVLASVDFTAASGS